MQYVEITRDLFDALEMLSDREEGAVCYALLKYAFEGVEDTYRIERFSKMALAVYLAAKPSMVVKGTPSKAKKRKPLSLKHRMMILERDNFTCQYCGRSAPEVALEVDHVIPVSKGGSDKPKNLITACRECNNGKRAHVIGEDRNW